MRERQFIEQNKVKWKEFESLLKQKEKDSGKLGEMFVQITDDLSYARTFYPNRSVRVYLNRLAQQIFEKLYVTRKKKKNWFSALLVDSIPSAVFHARKELFLSLIIFIIAIGIGVFSAIEAPDFAKSILSEEYVEMTERNIENKDPMAVYKESNQITMFTNIALNNLFIDLKTFASGLLFGLWTVLMLVYNGIMVGVFQYFFYERGLFSDSFLTIWMHGALEMSAAVIVGGAGLILGRGLVFPGTYSRLQSLIIGAKQALKIFLIGICMTTLAAFIESFVTRYTDMNNVIRLIWIMLSFSFVIGYFVILPLLKNKRGTLLPQQSERLLPNMNNEIQLNVVKTIGKIFSDSFSTYRNVLVQYLQLSLIMATVYTLGNAVFNYQTIHDNFIYQLKNEWLILSSIQWTYTNIGQIFFKYTAGSRLLFNFLLWTFALSASILLFMRELIKSKNITLIINKYKILLIIFISSLFSVIIQLYILLPVSIYPLFIVGGMPFFLMIYILFSFNERKATGLKSIKYQVLSGYGLLLSYTLICTFLFTLLTCTVFGVFLQFGQMLLDLESIDYYKIFITTYLFFSSLALLLVIPPIVFGFGYLYFSGKEMVEANGLRQRFTFLDHPKSKEA